MWEVWLDRAWQMRKQWQWLQCHLPPLSHRQQSHPALSPTNSSPLLLCHPLLTNLHSPFPLPWGRLFLPLTHPRVAPPSPPTHATTTSSLCPPILPLILPPHVATSPSRPPHVDAPSCSCPRSPPLCIIVVPWLPLSALFLHRLLPAPPSPPPHDPTPPSPCREESGIAWGGGGLGSARRSAIFVARPWPTMVGRVEVVNHWWREAWQIRAAAPAA